jgi:hypothetical protein
VFRNGRAGSRADGRRVQGGACQWGAKCAPVRRARVSGAAGKAQRAMKPPDTHRDLTAAWDAPSIKSWPALGKCLGVLLLRRPKVPSRKDPLQQALRSTHEDGVCGVARKQAIVILAPVQDEHLCVVTRRAGVGEAELSQGLGVVCAGAGARVHGARGGALLAKTHVGRLTWAN